MQALKSGNAAGKLATTHGLSDGQMDGRWIAYAKCRGVKRFAKSRSNPRTLAFFLVFFSASSHYIMYSKYIYSMVYQTLTLPQADSLCLTFLERTRN